MAMTEARTITGWELGFQTLEAELDETELEVTGTLPTDLDGVLYRVGPARHDVYGDRYQHWFDGDGMVHALRLGGGHGRKIDGRGAIPRPDPFRLQFKGR